MAMACFYRLKQNLQNAFKVNDRKVTLFVQIYQLLHVNVLCQKQMM